jgi:hypothetical protein
MTNGPIKPEDAKLKGLLQEKDPLTGRGTGFLSFSRVFGAITVGTGNALILAAIASEWVHEVPRIDLKEGFMYAALLIALGLLVYTGNATKLFANIVAARFGIRALDDS